MANKAKALAKRAKRFVRDLFDDRPAGTGQTSQTQPTSAGQKQSQDWAGLKRLAAALNNGADGFGPLKDATEILVSLISTFETAAGNRKDYQDLKVELDDLFGEIDAYISEPAQVTMTSSIKNLARWFSDFTHADNALQLNTTRDIRRELNEMAMENHLQRLPNSPTASYCSNGAANLRHGCTQNTRVDVLNGLQEWAQNPTSKKIYWLNGMAGTGKTTIAYSLSKELEKNETLAASFFCSRQIPECRDVNRIVPTIAYQLARFSLPFRQAVCRALKDYPDVCNRPVAEQFRHLVADPLNGVENTLPTGLVVVIDALDECEAETGVSDILDTVLSHAPDLPLKFFVSSRPDSNILAHMRHKQGERVNTEMRLHELAQTVVQTDIRTYLTDELGASFKVGAAQMDFLVERSGVLFIYAATVVRYIKGHNLSRGELRLARVLESPTGSSGLKTEAIDRLYTTIIQAAYDDEELTEADRVEMLLVLHTVICAREPMSEELVARFLRFKDKRHVQAAVGPLLSVLQVSETTGVIATLHESFRDYVLDELRSGRFYCDSGKHHTQLAYLCFYHLSLPKPFNVCCLRSSYAFDQDIPGLQEQIDNVISEELFYSCRHWHSHLISSERSEAVMNLLLNFLSKRLFMWMEIMNLKQAFAHGMQMIYEIESSTRTSSWLNENGKSLLQDAWKFMSMCISDSVLKSTPHIYVSALLFWLSDSLLKRIYHSAIPGMIGDDSTAMEQRRVTSLLTMNARALVQVVGYSPDGAYVVSGSWDNTVRIWDIRSGKQVGQSLDGHTSGVSSVGYSPDGAYIVSGSDDNTVRIWDARTGKQVGQSLDGHTSGVWSVGYSPDGAYIVSGSDDNTVRIWDARTGKQVGQSLDGHTSGVYSVGYSPDGAYIVSGSHDKTMRIWDARTGKQVGQSLDGHTSPVNSVGYSPDGAYIVSGSDDNTVRIWDARTGKQVGQSLDGHTSPVNSVGYSPDGAYIVSGSWDNTVRIWDARTGKQVGQSLDGHTSPVSSVGYSPDGAYIVSGSSDKTVRIWDARTGKQVGQSLDGHTSAVFSVGYSPDGAYIVSGSSDNTVRIWDARTGKQVGQSLDGHTRAVNSVGYSPDGAYIVSGSHDKTVRIWDARTGKQVGQSLDGHTSEVSSVGYSPDGAYIVSGSDDNTVRIWDARTGKQVGQSLDGHTSEVYSVGYSPDGAYIVSGSHDNTVRIWDARTGKQVGQSLDGHTSPVNSVGYSPDGAYIVSGSWDNTVRIWDARTGKQVGQSLDGHTSPVSSVGYSPDGAYIVSGSWDKTVRIWDARTGKQVGQSLDAHTSRVSSVGYSPDGAYIVSGSHDNTVRIWDAGTTKQVGQPLESHTDQVNSVTYSPDGLRAVSGSSDNAIRFYEPPACHSINHPDISQPNDRFSSDLFYDKDHLAGVATNTASHICGSACHATGRHRTWNLNQDGWLVLDTGELLLWVPPDLRVTLVRPQNSAVMFSRFGALHLQFDPDIIGENWSQHFCPSILRQSCLEEHRP
ncbi:WD repeat-containing protein [Ceratobasidium sp. AG-Ba]|nr:WD repeat-containing protein [Ceratobasidium sp. AG-Ba]